MTSSMTLMTPTTALPAGPPPRGPSLAGLVRLEARKSLSTRSGVALAATAALLAPAGVTANALSTTADVGRVASLLGGIAMITALVVLAVGGLATAGEWSHRTVQTTYLLVPRRGRVLVAKEAAVALLGAVLAAVSVGLAAAALALFGHGADWTGAGRAVAVAVLAGAVFAAIGAGVGAALANTPATLTGLYLLFLAVLPLLEGVVPQLLRADPVKAVLLLAQGDGVGAAAGTLAGWVLVSTVAGALLSNRRPVQ